MVLDYFTCYATLIVEPLARRTARDLETSLSDHRGRSREARLTPKEGKDSIYTPFGGFQFLPVLKALTCTPIPAVCGVEHTLIVQHHIFFTSKAFVIQHMRLWHYGCYVNRGQGPLEAVRKSEGSGLS
jgi:hypothetical protein